MQIAKYQIFLVIPSQFFLGIRFRYLQETIREGQTQK